MFSEVVVVFCEISDYLFPELLLIISNIRFQESSTSSREDAESGPV
jgi:hypothetical protein